VLPGKAAAAALTGEITDPRDLPSRLGIDYPSLTLPLRSGPLRSGDGQTHLEAPLPEAGARQVKLVKGPSIGTLRRGGSGTRFGAVRGRQGPTGMWAAHLAGEG
jgi:hypothetical protein